MQWIINNMYQFMGALAAFATIIATFYAWRSYHLSIHKALSSTHGSIEIFFSRDVMVASLLKMYSRVEPGDIIWAQTVGMRNYPGKVHETILEAASKGVRFRMILNKNSYAVTEFRRLFETIKSAELIEASDNSIRVQGLSKKEVIIAFPSLTSYTAIRFTDPNFVEIIKDWFDRRFESLSLEKGVVDREGVK